MSYAWDTAGRLTGITKNGSTQATFAYDGDGNRRSKTSGGQTTTYVNDARGLAQVLRATTGSATVTYVPGSGQYDSSKATEAEKWGFTLSDAQNARLLVDGAGTVAHTWEWEPFGKARIDAGSTAAAFTFGGEQKDDETGLINLRARYYDPGIGRFLSRDSLPGVMSVPQSWNRYSYVENDPINAIDPSGHKKKIKYANGADPDDDSGARKKAKACKNPGQYTGSCKGGPPNAAYAADGEAQHAAKKAGQAAAAGYLAAAAAHMQAAAHYASIAGTAAAETAAAQAAASIWAAYQAVHGAQAVDNRSGADLMMKEEMTYEPIPDPGDGPDFWYYFDVPAFMTDAHWSELESRIQFLVDIRLGANNRRDGTMRARAIWTYMVGTNHPWDNKSKFDDDDPRRQVEADIGNFMYGATGNAAGWDSVDDVRRGAGGAQWVDNVINRSDKPKPSSGSPADRDPKSCFGDRCRDQRYIVNGWFWYAARQRGEEFSPSSLPPLTP